MSDDKHEPKPRADRIQEALAHLDAARAILEAERDHPTPPPLPEPEPQPEDGTEPPVKPPAH